MATEPNTLAPATPAAGTASASATGESAANEKRKDVLNDMDSRRILPNVADAIAYLAACMDPTTGFHDFAKYPIAAPGVSTDEDGNIVFDPEVYDDSMNVMVAVLTERGDGAGSSKVKAIVIVPAPKLETILANPDATQWLTRIMEKELNHVAVRQLRKADDIADVVESMPTSLQDYITSNRESGGLLAAYEELWRPIKNSMGKLSRPFRLANLSKKEFRRGMESSAYASEYYPTLEQAKQGSLFVFALNGFIAQSKKQGLDPTIFERWLAGRDEKQIDVKAEDDDEDFSLEDLAGAFEEATAPATPATPANDQPTAEAASESPAPEGTEQPAPTPEGGEPNAEELSDEELERMTAPETPAEEPAPVAEEEQPQG